jgi:hypothetical protein
MPKAKSPQRRPKPVGKSPSESKLAGLFKRTKRTKATLAETENADKLDELIADVRGQLEETVDNYNRNRTDTKKNYARIQQLRGALEVLTSLEESDFTVVRRTE